MGVHVAHCRKCCCPVCVEYKLCFMVGDLFCDCADFSGSVQVNFLDFSVDACVSDENRDLLSVNVYVFCHANFSTIPLIREVTLSPFCRAIFTISS